MNTNMKAKAADEARREHDPRPPVAADPCERSKVDEGAEKEAEPLDQHHVRHGQDDSADNRCGYLRLGRAVGNLSRRRFLEDAFQHARNLLAGLAEEEVLHDLEYAGEHRQRQDRLRPDIRTDAPARCDESDPVREHEQNLVDREHDHVRQTCTPQPSQHRMQGDGDYKSHFFAAVAAA